MVELTLVTAMVGAFLMIKLSMRGAFFLLGLAVVVMGATATAAGFFARTAPDGNHDYHENNRQD
jgi:hypothetical protein